MTVELRFLLSLALIVASTLAGYLARKLGLARESYAQKIMTLVSVIGYPVVGLFAIWRIPLHGSIAWLPLLGGAQATLMALTALRIGRTAFPDRAERGMVGFSCGIGNHGVTMAGFVIYLLFGNLGLGYSTVYAAYTFFAFVLLSYSIAQAHSPEVRRRSLAEMTIRNLLDWRAAGLYTAAAAVAMSAFRVPFPTVVERWRLVDVTIYAVIVFAYFSIGLRLHVPHIFGMGRAIAVTLMVRHLVGPAIGLGLAGLTLLTPWPIHGLALKVFLIQSSVSVGVMGVAVANMFRIKPQEASALFIVSSVVYLAAGIPLVLWIFRGASAS